MPPFNRSTRRWKKIRKQFRETCQQTQAPCWLCTHDIDYTITNPNDDAVWEPDHLYPVSTHPHLYEDPGNLRPSHRKCNNERKNKQFHDLLDLGTPKRDWFTR